MSNIYTRMKAYREKLNMSQKKLAEKTGVRRETVVRLEKGQYNPSLKLAMDIAGELRAAVEDIFVFAESEEAAGEIFRRRDAGMLEAGFVDLHDQAFQEGFEMGLTDSSIKMLAKIAEHAKISMSEEKWEHYKKSEEDEYRKYRKENPDYKDTNFDAEGRLIREKWIVEQKLTMICSGFPKEGWDDVCAFVLKYPELSPTVLARRIIRESEYKYI